MTTSARKSRAAKIKGKTKKREEKKDSNSAGSAIDRNETGQADQDRGPRECQPQQKKRKGGYGELSKKRRNHSTRRETAETR